MIRINDLIAKSLRKNFFQELTVLAEPFLEKKFCKIVVAWKQREFLIVTLSDYIISMPKNCCVTIIMWHACNLHAARSSFQLIFSLFYM